MQSSGLPVLGMVGVLAMGLCLALAPGPSHAKVNNTTTRSNTQHNLTARHPSRRAGRRRHHPVTIVRNVDSASPTLYKSISGK